MTSRIILNKFILLTFMIIIQNAMCKMVAQCPKYWIHRTGSKECYLIHSYGHDRSRDDAKTYCKQHGGNLIYITDQDTIDWLTVHIADSGLVGENAQVWVNIQKQDDGSWTWPEPGKPVDNALLPWQVEGEDGDSKCAVFTVDQKLLKLNCGKQKHFICHRDITKPLMCDMDNDWVDQNGNCYKMSNDRQSWHDSATSCEKDQGGWLMVVNGQYEAYYVYDEATRVRDNTWIGLTEEGHPGAWKWYTGDNTTWRNWNEDKGEPKSRNGFGSAIVDQGDKDGGGRWFNEDIMAKHRYMCEKKRGSCASGWQNFKNQCYYFNSLPSDNSVFDTANATCQSVGGHLAIINNDDENNFLFSTMAGDDQLWIGLYSIPHDKFYWINGKTMDEIGYTLLSDSEVDNTITEKDERQCVFMKHIKDDNNNDVPKWVISDCTQPQHFICEIASSTNIIIPPPSTEIYCPEGWVNWADHCYNFVSDELQWTAAQTECKKVSGADLASITSWPENDFIHNSLEAATHAWLGLNDRGQEGKYLWTDSSHTNIMNWAPNEPSGIGENCVEMYDTGKWNDQSCGKKRPYVCKMPASEHPVGPIDITTPNSTPESEACGWDWIENPVSGECYRIETEKLTWWDAISHCHSLHDYDYHGHDHDIVSLTTAQEQDFVYSLLQDANMNQPSIWTGLQADYDGMHWSDNTPLHYFNYNDGEPNSYGAEPCTELYMDSGKWNDQDCDKRTAFVCEKKGENYVEPVAPPPPDINCPKGWNFFNDYCYYQVIDDTKSWEDAHSVCKEQYGGELTSITSQEENDFIFGFIQYNQMNSWIGLHDNNNGSNWHWTDGNNYDNYQNWMPGEPNNSEGTEHCGQIIGETWGSQGLWNDNTCSLLYPFICKISVSTCPPGWQFDTDECYYASNLPATWSGARTACKDINENADLVSVHNDEENSFFSSIVNTGMSGAWLGYKYRNNSDTWKWSDGSPSDYENWNAGEPNLLESEWCSESIIFYNDETHGKWNNLECSESRYYGCKLNGANITHTVGCDKNWHYFNNYCYYYSDFNYDTYGSSYSDALGDCESKGGSLASIHSVEEDDFVYSLVGIDGYGSAWVGMSSQGHNGELLWSDGTDISYTNWGLIDSTVFWSQNLCAQYENQLLTGQWIMNDCEAYQNYYVCKKAAETVPINPPITTGCKENDVDYKGSCYNFQEEENTWEDAESDCIADYGGHTVVINDQFESAFISSYLKGRDSHWWTGLKGTAADDGSVTFAWVNGDPVDFTNWSEYEPAPNHGLCVAASGHDTLPGFWEVTECGDPRHYICEYDNDGYVPPPTPSTTPPPPPNCATNWTHNADEQRCYKVFSSPSTWGMAENHCKRLGGHLTSVGSAEEQTFIKTLPGISDLDARSFKIWIGLHQGSETGYEWTDGTPEGFLDWDSGQPDSDDHREDCVAANKDSMKESDDVCETYYPYVCEAQQGMTMTTLSPPTEGPVQYCDDDTAWILYEEHCYKIVSASDEALSFRSSSKGCHADGAELLSIHSSEENAFINSRIYSLSDNELWLGGLATLDGGFHWIDNSSFEYFNWGQGQPDNWHDQESCVAIYTNHDNGYWNDANCASLNGHICKRPNGKTLPPPITPKPPSGHCPDGWTHIGSRCIQLFKGDNTTDWETSRQKCKDLGSGANLISVHSEQDQAAIAAFVGRSGRSAWLGFYNAAGFHWADQSEVDYTHWAAGEPNGNSQTVNEDCAMAYYWNGQWNDAPCDLTNDYICQRSLDSGIATHKPPPACSGEFSAYFNYSGACYKAVTEQKTWQDAESTCASEGSHLSSVESVAENSYIFLLGVEAGINSPWIGLNSLQDGSDGNRVFSWSDGWPTLYSNWGPGNPNASLTNHRCARISGNDGLWYTSKCSVERPFLCKYSEQTIPTPDPPSTGKCPDNRWKNLGGGYCYLINNEGKTWSEANLACISEGVKDSPSNLVSIHSEAEKNLILQISNDILSPVWIGLAQMATDFGWSDGTALDFVNWDNGEPNSNDEKCGTVNAHSGTWNDMVCTNVLPYICKIKKIQIQEPTNPTQQPPKHTTTAGPGEYIAPGLSAGGIVGIVFAVLFVFAAVGFLGYHYTTKPKAVPFSNLKNSAEPSSSQEPVDIGSNFGVTDA